MRAAVRVHVMHKRACAQHITESKPLSRRESIDEDGDKTHAQSDRQARCSWFAKWCHATLAARRRLVKWKYVNEKSGASTFRHFLRTLHRQTEKSNSLERVWLISCHWIFWFCKDLLTFVRYLSLERNTILNAKPLPVVCHNMFTNKSL